MSHCFKILVILLNIYIHKLVWQHRLSHLSLFHLKVVNDPLDCKHHLEKAPWKLELGDSCSSLGKESTLCRQLGHIFAFLFGPWCKVGMLPGRLGTGVRPDNSRRSPCLLCGSDGPYG